MIYDVQISEQASRNKTLCVALIYKTEFNNDNPSALKQEIPQR
jgi:hypothetical protein